MKQYSVTSTTGHPFRRDGYVFHPSIPTVLDELQMTDAIRNEKALEITEIEAVKPKKTKTK